MFGFALASANGSRALAQDHSLSDASGPDAETAAASTAQADDSATDEASEVRFVSQAVVQPLPGEDGQAADEEQLAESAGSLEQLVEEIPTEDKLSKDMRCLAGAIYFEARGEPLAGQLAVGRVIVNRAESDRFPSSYCDVVLQPAQFSFVRGGQIPSINTGSPAWQRAKAIAKIAHEGLWESPAKGALFFHAAYVSPHWGLTRLAKVDHHIFYR
jgi:spore germination cell wall hydrolase CwlJ-like protein